MCWHVLKFIRVGMNNIIYDNFDGLKLSYLVIHAEDLSSTML